MGDSTSSMLDNSVYADASAPNVDELMIAPGDSYEEKKRKLNGVLMRHRVTVAQADELVRVSEMKIVFVCDDSGSMQASAGIMSRWDELRETVSKFLEIAVYITDSVDVHFLSRPSVTDIKSWDDPRIAASFRSPPQGSTPLVTKLNEMLSTRRCRSPTLLLIATDGEPDEGSANFRDLCTHMVNSLNYKIQILACTNDKHEIRWLNKFDKSSHAIDVMDDFQSERRQILRRGRVKSFNKADYVVKGLLGPICKKFDDLDEGCCSVM
eukprot:TRINITY_DN1976_c0_g1_i1.p1 TRINITY_DN1976_c0_g1~~TRINITY_DN1976_c0_g1_i1.p1  ORF type:complete len:297 (+),score=39.95 TRINITY_DN1976_c0_g1_i1:93-893(+)